MGTPRSLGRQQRSGKTGPGTLPAPNTDAGCPLLPTERSSCRMVHCPRGQGRLWRNLPNPSLIRGARERPQLMGGNWKAAPTEAREATAVWTRSGWTKSGPAVHRRTGSEWETRPHVQTNARIGQEPFFPASVRKVTTDLRMLFSGR